MSGQGVGRQSRKERQRAETKCLRPERRWNETDGLDAAEEELVRSEGKERCSENEKRKRREERGKEVERQLQEEAKQRPLKGILKKPSSYEGLDVMGDHQLQAERRAQKEAKAQREATQGSTPCFLEDGAESRSEFEKAFSSTLVIRGTTERHDERAHYTNLVFRQGGSSSSTGKAPGIRAKVRRGRAGIVIKYEEEEESENIGTSESCTLLPGMSLPSTSHGYQFAIGGSSRLSSDGKRSDSLERGKPKEDPDVDYTSYCTCV